MHQIDSRQRSPAIVWCDTGGGYLGWALKRSPRYTFAMEQTISAARERSVHDRWQARQAAPRERRR